MDRDALIGAWRECIRGADKSWGAVRPGHLRDPHAAGAGPRGPGAGIAGRVGSDAGELLVGMHGRSRRGEDAEALAVIHVEDRR
ncbi:Uncharacterised protein [Pseudomonas aeruginosa]|nr:Uncharacterised protein [Pseudomonas aeruginosa]